MEREARGVSRQDHPLKEATMRSTAGRGRRVSPYRSGRAWDSARAAKALIPWINQALGMPNDRVSGSLEELETRETAQLE
jgi:hypothetical protein